MSGFLAPFSANVYFPALNVIQEDLHSTTALVSLTVTMYMVVQGISPSIWGSLADSWGRRPIYVTTIFIYFSACICLANAPNYAALLILRMVQAFGSSSVIAIGAGTIGDIAAPSERGGYMGIYSLGTMLGPILGPVLGKKCQIGGLLAQSLGWRWIFWLLALFGFTLWCLLVLFLPETLRSLVQDGSGYANPTPFQYFKHRRAKRDQREKMAMKKKSLRQRLPNPFRTITYLKEKDIAVILLYNSLQYAGFYCVLTSMTKLFMDIYGLNAFKIGLCFLATGFGASAGSFTSGRILNWQFKKMATAMGLDSQRMTRGDLHPDFPIEKARMNLTWVWGLLCSIILLLYGWMLHIKVHLAVSLFLHVIVGFCSTSTFNATNTLLVDLFPHNSAAIVAASNFTKCLFGAVAVLIINPGIAMMGVGWMFTIVSAVLCISRVLIVLELRYGPSWRSARQNRSNTNVN
ncbi:major facilitator superfamily domain-containing protein [Radiomyces spectabilis]|uniref:major facilitator superfamily domain-containing protein n=1 Tax=Radiomyces spectabilis TaxID=64574 RepID=UPI00221F2BCA|nr:major facilitator superfamily domain-containing protein [Radiomyces spectabilis]KAI8377841.1 major facilitator superfamily domain-containing protein [Radiomyces spectabilis]